PPGARVVQVAPVRRIARRGFVGRLVGGQIADRTGRLAGGRKGQRVDVAVDLLERRSGGVGGESDLAAVLGEIPVEAAALKLPSAIETGREVAHLARGGIERKQMSGGTVGDVGVPGAKPESVGDLRLGLVVLLLVETF